MSGVLLGVVSLKKGCTQKKQLTCNKKMPLLFFGEKREDVGKSIGYYLLLEVSLETWIFQIEGRLVGILYRFYRNLPFTKLYQKLTESSTWKNPSNAMWLCVFVRTCLQGSYLEISWFRHRRFWDVDSVHPLDPKCQDQYQLTFLTFLTCGSMTAMGLFFWWPFEKAMRFFVGENCFFFKGRHMKSIWWKCGVCYFRYLTRYFFS